MDIFQIIDLATLPFLKVLRIITGFAYRKYLKDIFAAQHLLVAHSIRNIAEKAERTGFDSLDRKDFDPLALHCSLALATYLNRDQKDICCTIKFCCPTQDPKQKVEVITLGRSHPNSRPCPPNGREPKKHYVEENSSLCALLGRDDGKNTWTKPLPYFFSPNLDRYQKKFQCSRSEFKSYYKTILVLPLRVQNFNNETVTIYGFLTFDSLKKRIFRGRGAVDTRKHHSNWTKYTRSVECSPLINFCGSMADNITSMLYPYIQGRGTR